VSHYFETPGGAERRHTVSATIWGRSYAFLSANGVFSADRLDPGTALLFRYAAPPANTPARFLDLGCGFGPIAIALADRCPQATVYAIDTNERALDLTRDNARRHHLADRIIASAPDDVPAGVTFDEIWSNPPIRIGKPALHDLLDRWLGRLTPTGRAFLVVGRHLGADSLATWLTTRGWAVERLGSSAGFRVMTVSSPDSNRC